MPSGGVSAGAQLLPRRSLARVPPGGQRGRGTTRPTTPAEEQGSAPWHHTHWAMSRQSSGAPGWCEGAGQLSSTGRTLRARPAPTASWSHSSEAPCDFPSGKAGGVRRKTELYIGQQRGGTASPTMATLHLTSASPKGGVKARSPGGACWWQGAGPGST